MNSAAGRPRKGQLAYRSARMSVLYRVGAPLSVVLDRCPVAVAGARDPTPFGAHLARELGRRLAEMGYAVVTGFARGVDAEATLGALERGGCAAAVLPYLFERGSKLNPHAAWLLRIASKHKALASAVAENLVKEDSRIRAWLAARNRIIVRLAVALVVPEAKFRPARWGTRYAVEHALEMGRPVVVLEPHVKNSDVVEAFERFRRRGAVAAKDVGEAISVVERYACLKSRR